MKKTLLTLSLTSLSSLLAAGASADTILGIYAGAGNWKSSYEGELGDPNNDPIEINELNLEDSGNVYVYFALEHPVPVIPNIRLAHTKIQTEGTSDPLSRDFTLDGETFSGSTTVTTDMDLTHTDATLYYELLDNWVSIDVGVTARLFDGYVEVTAEDGQNEMVEFTAPLPLAYARAQIDLPLTGWHLAAGGNFISYDDDSLSDFDVKFGYMSDGFILDLGLDIGYRRINLDVTEDDLRADVTIAGPYLEASVHF